MFWQLYQYRLKRLVNDKVQLFWTAMFPIVLGTFFYLAFSGISTLCFMFLFLFMNSPFGIPKEDTSHPHHFPRGATLYSIPVLLLLKPHTILTM